MRHSDGLYIYQDTLSCSQVKTYLSHNLKGKLLIFFIIIIRIIINSLLISSVSNGPPYCFCTVYSYFFLNFIRAISRKLFDRSQHFFSQMVKCDLNFVCFLKCLLSLPVPIYGRLGNFLRPFLIKADLNIYQRSEMTYIGLHCFMLRYKT